jgi:serine/threonine-protein kinase RIO1
MLSLGIVHGDLSAYNVLYWQGKITLIDFPQVVNPVDNPDAPAIFERDVTRICQYFAAQGAVRDPVATAEALWSDYVPEGLDIEQLPEFQAAKLDAEMAAIEARAREEDDDDDDDDEYDDEYDD